MAEDKVVPTETPGQVSFMQRLRNLPRLPVYAGLALLIGAFGGYYLHGRLSESYRPPQDDKTYNRLLRAVQGEGGLKRQIGELETIIGPLKQTTEKQHGLIERQQKLISDYIGESPGSKDEGTE